ncbi:MULTISPECIES: DUF2254 domain-containing protein [Microbacterium]|uniref:DUF2254 domain-containing protein n=1 Tax=Microbacterium TaxID=33882 RepID=UPI0027830FDD|nr:MULTISPECIES: DUF2254 domain-containing protein [Microbacterium]MDQ1085225.1 putative membrane protein [Microbacterium sp. SORGH_AS_0344]MDQ1169469.1 putative membrane protein [Microbacterium proteolyticum]
MATTTRSSLASFFLRLGRQVWVRAAVFTLIAVIVALAAGFLGPLLPFELGIELGQNAVGSLLQIIATAMLTVSTFSVTAMVTAFSSATTTATPRSTPLLIADPTSQNAVSTFVGAFTFSLVGIVALSTGYYTPQGRIILFVSTLVIIGIVVFTLLRWISHLSTFGRMADVIDRVEKAATTSFEVHAAAPTLGARPSAGRVPDATAVHAEQVGYVTHIGVAALDRLAHDRGIEVHVEATPGRIADARVPLVRIVGDVDDDVRQAVRRAFRIEHHRTYEQDPRFGVIALTEIGTRALSAATNDPGTAIEVIAALQRVFARGLAVEPRPDVDYERVRVVAPRLQDLVDDAFRPLARDGAADVEVQVRLQKCLASLAASAPAHAAVFRDAARAAYERSRRALDRADGRVLRAAVREAWGL